MQIYHLIHHGIKVRASTIAVKLIKDFESCKLEAYPDAKGKYAIGWGTVGPGIREGLTISQSLADGMLVSDLSQLGQDITQLVGIRVNQFQFDALVSLTYNIGLSALKNSTLLKYVLAHKTEAAADEFLKWDHSEGKVIPGLTRRREAERKLFLTNIP